MTVAQFYGLIQRDYAGPTYPAEYFHCFADANSSEAATSRDSWLDHYWPDPSKPFDFDDLIDRLVRTTCFGYAKTIVRRDRKIAKIILAKDALKSRFTDIALAVNGILLHDDTTPALAIRVLHGLELPGFGQLSFGSKLLMFLKPKTFVVLDSKVVGALHQNTVRGDHFTRAFTDCCDQLHQDIHAIGKTNLGTIPPRGPWPEIYGAWCAACEAEVQRWNDRPDHSGELWIASDIERVAFSTPSAKPVSLNRK